MATLVYVLTQGIPVVLNMVVSFDVFDKGKPKAVTPLWSIWLRCSNRENLVYRYGFDVQAAQHQPTN